ncbi:MAG: hypothetical protein ACREH8_16510 [Opitutaceae bacterium]
MKTIRCTAAPIRAGLELARFEAIDRRFVDWAREWGAEELQFPALIDDATLERAEYPAAFPHLLMSACACTDAARPLTTLLEAENLMPTGWLLSPAVCYHLYPHWEDQVIRTGRIASARGRCFRHEDEFVPGRRQLEFEMREIVLCGPIEWINERVGEARARIPAVAAEVGFAGTWETAIDPFFLPTAQGKAHFQRLQETKHEFVVRNPAPLAVASINRHGTFFSERFRLSLARGGPAHTACIAFGLDRWASAASG